MGGFNPLCNSKINKVLRDGGAGYTEVKTEVIFPKTTAQFLDADMGLDNYYYDIGTITLESGVEYWVTWDDAVYACVAYVSNNKAVLGDENILWGESGGVPFFVTPLGSSTYSIYTLENKEHTFGITQKTETIHPIDPKFLPGTTDIDLADYGIDIITAILSGGGHSQAGNTAGLWEKINKSDNFRFVSFTGSQHLYISPQLISKTENIITSVAFIAQFVVADNILTVANVILACGISNYDITSINCAVTNLTME